jgi:arylsulfatase A-like enzyme
LQADWVQEVDHNVGQVMDALRESGLAEKTLVIFTSDNGGPVVQGANNGPLRGSKASVWEGGIRTCTLAWWPGQVPAGTSTAAITSMMDILPTFARLAGARLPSDRKLDGVDQWPVLAGESSPRDPRDTFHCFRGLQLEAIRQGPWKLHLAKGELYNLEADIGEATNVASAHAEVVERLRMLAQSMETDLGLNGRGPGCRPLGRVKDPQPLIAHDGQIRQGFE